MASKITSIFKCKAFFPLFSWSLHAQQNVIVFTKMPNVLNSICYVFIIPHIQFIFWCVCYITGNNLYLHQWELNVINEEVCLSVKRSNIQYLWIIITGLNNCSDDREKLFGISTPLPVCNHNVLYNHFWIVLSTLCWVPFSHELNPTFLVLFWCSKLGYNAWVNHNFHLLILVDNLQ